MNVVCLPYMLRGVPIILLNLIILIYEDHKLWSLWYDSHKNKFQIEFYFDFSFYLNCRAHSFIFVLPISLFTLLKSPLIFVLFSSSHNLTFPPKAEEMQSPIGPDFLWWPSYMIEGTARLMARRRSWTFVFSNGWVDASGRNWEARGGSSS